jgi:multidrug resistance efflux pump
MKRHLAIRTLITLSKGLLTLAIILAGAHAARMLWSHYRTTPWTRDGRVIAETVQIVPEVSGKISELRVTDNQWVQKGDVLLVIDPASYALALRSAEAILATRQHDLTLKTEVANRRQQLAEQKAIAAEELQTAVNALEVARCEVMAAMADRDLAQLNLERTTLVSPVNGYITNLHLRPGEYASSGQPQFSILDSDSFWVAAYFEETKLTAVHPGDVARIDLMGGGHALRGRVESISRGIADPTAATKGLATIDPVFNWVRLAQRIPVRIKLDPLPPDLFLSSGMTCNVHLSRDHSPPKPEPAVGAVAAHPR